VMCQRATTCLTGGSKSMIKSATGSGESSLRVTDGDSTWILFYWRAARPGERQQPYGQEALWRRMVARRRLCANDRHNESLLQRRFVPCRDRYPQPPRRALLSNAGSARQASICAGVPGDRCRKPPRIAGGRRPAYVDCEA